LPCFALVWLVWKGRLGEDIVGEGREAAGGGVEPGADRWPPGGDKRCLAVYVCRSSGWDCRVVWLSRRFPLLPLPTLWPALGLCQSDVVIVSRTHIPRWILDQALMARPYACVPVQFNTQQREHHGRRCLGRQGGCGRRNK
jgi:hypothetical protein